MAEYSDNFNRADGSLGDDWEVWAHDYGTNYPEIESNEVVSVDGEAAGAVWDGGEMASTDYFSQMICGGSGLKVSVRDNGVPHEETNCERYYLQGEGQWHQYTKLFKVIGSTVTELDEAQNQGTSSAGETHKIEADGSNIAGYWGGSLRVEAEDTAITSKGAPGFWFVRYASESGDDWSAEDLAAVGPPTPTNLQGTPGTNSILWTWEAGE